MKYNMTNLIVSLTLALLLLFSAWSDIGNVITYTVNLKIVILYMLAGFCYSFTICTHSDILCKYLKGKIWK